MKRLLILASGLVLALCGLPATAANTQARLVLSHEAARPGETVMAGIHLHMAPRWHTYWRNAGESGTPTKIEWTLPQGIKAGEIQWPVPEKFASGGIVTYVYHGDAVLLVPLKLDGNLPASPLELAAKVSWLECEESCVPGQTEVKARLIIGNETKPSADIALIEAAKKKLPPDSSVISAIGRWEKPGSGDTQSLIIGWKTKSEPVSADFLPYGGEHYEVAPATDMLPYDSDTAWLRKTVLRSGTDWPRQIGGVLVHRFPGEPEPAAYEVSLTVGATSGPTSAVAVSSTFLPRLTLLLKMLVLAFLGGLILNVMPCVFPVIALKILGFVQQSAESPRHVFRLGLIYALGVVASFLALAGAVIAVRQTGGAASWGMQMQNPQFTLLLTVLVTLVALNLFGLFEFNLAGHAMGAAAELAAKQGEAGAFFNGVLATVLATPCTAPFLAPALGCAFTQPPAIIALVFVTVGLGLAAPYIVLSWRPAWLRFLPKPGAWMEHFKVAMGFPMLATALWLFSFTGRRFGTDGHLGLGLLLIFVALAAWVWGQFVQRGTRRKGSAMTASLSVLAVGYFCVLEGQLHWRSPVKKTPTDRVAESSAEGIVWKKWSPEAVQEARAEGRPVLVDFTADWCLTCKYNKRTALDVAAVRAKLNELNAVTLRADNTDEDPAIVAELKKFDRAGVPLVLIYPRDAKAPPIVLPALLTKGIVLDALTRAAR
jgi:thiol:disulfide interchange protein